jgi:hypothetical protein
LVDARFGAGAVISMAGIDGALFATDQEVSGIRSWKGHARGGEIFGFRWRGRCEGDVLLRLGEHVDCPAADDTVSGCGDDVVRILCTDDIDRVDGMGVARASEGGFLNGCRMTGASVPEVNLTGVRSTKYERGVERGEFGA